jgi:hypothetical protein
MAQGVQQGALLAGLGVVRWSAGSCGGSRRRGDWRLGIWEGLGLSYGNLQFGCGMGGCRLCGLSSGCCWEGGKDDVAEAVTRRIIYHYETNAQNSGSLDRCGGLPELADGARS